MNWLTNLLGIQKDSNPQKWFDLFFKGKEDKENQLRVLSPIADPVTPPAPSYTPNEQGVRDIYKNQLGPAVRESTNLEEYYPLMAESGYVKEKSTRPGMYELMMLMGLQESTGGRATNNVFGVKPGGEVGEFGNVREAVDYQVSPNVLGGGVNNSLNILSGQGLISEEEIRKIMKSYNPEEAYLDWLVENYRNLTK